MLCFKRWMQVLSWINSDMIRSLSSSLIRKCYQFQGFLITQFFHVWWEWFQLLKKGIVRSGTFLWHIHPAMNGDSKISILYYGLPNLSFSGTMMSDSQLNSPLLSHTLRPRRRVLSTTVAWSLPHSLIHSFMPICGGWWDHVLNMWSDIGAKQRCSGKIKGR